MDATPDPGAIDPIEQLNALGQAVITTNREAVVLFWNAAAERLYGWTADEAIGRNVADLTVPEMALDVGTDILAALRDGVPWSGAFPVRRKDGSRFSALVTDAGIYRDGVLVGIIGVSVNLGTALRPLLERSTDAALVLQSDAMISYASPAVRQLFGWVEDDLIGTSIVALLHPADRVILGDCLRRLLDEPGAHPPVELRVRHNGAWSWAEAALANFLDDPDVRGVVCNLRLSVRRGAHEQAETRVGQLESALSTRIVIEQAKGYVAGRNAIDLEAAFERLRSHARHHRLQIHDVARRVVDGEAAAVIPVE